VAPTPTIRPARPEPEASSRPEPTPQAPPGPPVEHVVVVSVDGLNPDAITRLGPAGAPTFHHLMREGAFTLNARTEVEQTDTLPNHTGMLTGRRIDRDRGGHGVGFNDDQGSTVQEAAGHPVASVFGAVAAAGGSTALYAGKDKFRVLRRSWPGSMDAFAVIADADRLTGTVVDDLRDGAPSLTFLHLAPPDVAGHASGFMSRPYLAAVARADRLLGRVLDVLPASGEDHLLVVTSDHGGRDGHRDAANPDNFTVPFLAWGEGVPAAADLYRLNPQLAEPDDERVGYAGPQPVRNGFVANLVTSALGLPAVRGSTLDADQSFNVWSR
jgi:hypothetical protein